MTGQPQVTSRHPNHQTTPAARQGAVAGTASATLRPVTEALSGPAASRSRQRLASALRMEAAGWRSIGRFLRRLVTRRSWTPAGATEFRYDSTFRGTLVAFTVVCAVEVVAVDLITHPWPLIRFPLLVLGIWGALFMLGMLLSYITRPHAVGPTGIWMRSGGDLNLELRWDDIHSVTHRTRRHGKSPALSVSGSPDDLTLLQVVDERTNIEISFDEPLLLALEGGSMTASRVFLFVDQPREFMKAARTHLAAYESAC